MSPTVEAAASARAAKNGDLVLALDAGGTKTAVWLAEARSDTGHAILGRGRSTSGNPLSVGFAGATRAITEAISLARNEAGLASTPVARAVLSIAGAIDPELRSQFYHWGRAVELAEQISIVPDVLPVLAAGTPQCCGVALISGTGSAAYARSADGTTSLCGGWGYLLGDEGSGYSIGRAAIRCALEDRDNKRAHRPLATALLKFLQVRSADELTKTVYRSHDMRSAIASVAPLVLQFAEDGDAVATAIVDEAARELASLAAAAARSVGLTETGSFALAATGGVLSTSKRLQTQLRQELAALQLDCQIQVVVEPLEGCLRLADPQFSGVAVDWQ